MNEEVVHQADKALSDLLALDLEFRLTLAMRSASGENCVCRDYLVRRRDVLFPAVLDQAAREDEDPIDIFARFARGFHAQHEE